MSLALPSPTPIDAFERREQWRFAIVVLALVAAHGGVVNEEGSVRTPTARRQMVATSTRSTCRPIRPPRGC
ncbi:MAG TPA: hypothetical protein VM143_18735 [Acidimicrobiales bacterium]|nr:hypothetical protein [Acidimicrobiales bacterium]